MCNKNARIQEIIVKEEIFQYKNNALNIFKYFIPLRFIHYHLVPLLVPLVKIKFFTIYFLIETIKANQTIEAKNYIFVFCESKNNNFVLSLREPDSGLKKQNIHVVVLQREPGTKKVSPSVRIEETRGYISYIHLIIDPEVAFSCRSWIYFLDRHPWSVEVPNTNFILILITVSAYVLEHVLKAGNRT